MVSEFFLNIIFNLLEWMLELLPEVSWSVNTSAFTYFMSIVDVVCYMLPVNTIITIAGIVIDLMIFRIVIAIVRTVWDLLPLV